MPCPLCGAAAKTTNGRYHYTQCGLEWVYLDGAEQVRCKACDDAFVTIPNEEILLELIAKMVLVNMQPLQAPEIRFLRGLIGWTQEKLATEIGVQRLAVVKWEAGTAHLGCRIDLILRGVWLRAFLAQKREDRCGVLAKSDLTRLTDNITKLGDTIALMKKQPPGRSSVSIDVRTNKVEPAGCPWPAS
jgi:DNA-binding transcriptional regulator YiaG